MKMKNKEIKAIFVIVISAFSIFLLYPMVIILIKSFFAKQGFSIEMYADVFTRQNFKKSLFNSVYISIISAVITTLFAFILAYSINYTNLSRKFKNAISSLVVVPMLIPTITYGFAIIYSFGKQGLLTKLFGHQLFDIYGFNGLVLGYVIYTLPTSFILLNNTISYIDKKFMIVSRAMGDSKFQTFWMTIILPLLGTFATSLIQAFFLCFTDYGIPASVGGNVEMIASLLYNEMLGSVPNFNTGSAIAIIMLFPSIISISLLNYLKKYNVRYNKISVIELEKNKYRDYFLGFLSLLILISVFSIFAVILIIPFVKNWPYDTSFSLEHLFVILSDKSLIRVYVNSLYAGVLSAIFGTVITYGSALLSARSRFSGSLGKIVDSVALVTNTIPGMVLGVAFLLAFRGSSIQNTFLIIIASNIVHFFSSPYLMMKNSLEKLNTSWETTALLMGDSWSKTVVRIITPNVITTILEVFSYYFVNALVTVSAVIFLAGSKTMVITTKIKELQHFANFNEIFVLSILILMTNILAKLIFKLFIKKSKVD